MNGASRENVVPQSGCSATRRLGSGEPKRPRPECFRSQIRSSYRQRADSAGIHGGYLQGNRQIRRLPN